MKPIPLPTLQQSIRRRQYIHGLRVVGYWALRYIIALAVVIADCIVWRL